MRCGPGVDQQSAVRLAHKNRFGREPLVGNHPRVEVIPAGHRFGAAVQVFNVHVRDMKTMAEQRLVHGGIKGDWIGAQQPGIARRCFFRDYQDTSPAVQFRSLLRITLPGYWGAIGRY